MRFPGVFAALLAIASVVLADDAQVIRGIEIEGNGRTRPEVIERAMRVSPGDPFDPEQIPVLEQRVGNLRLFEDVHIEPVGDRSGGVVLHVAVQERWTLVVLPIAGASSGASGAGLFLLESNLFGRGKQLRAGAFLSTRGTSANVGYRDPAVGGTRLLLTADFARQDLTREQDAANTAVYQYQDLRYDFGATVGWRLTDRLAVRGGWFSLLVDATTAAGYAPPPSAAPVRGLSSEVEYLDENFHLWHVTGVSARVRYRQGVAWLASGRGLYQASARASWSGRGFADHALTLTAAFDWSHGDPVVDAIRLGGQPGSRGFLRAGLWAESAATATAEYQVPVWRPSWGVLTAAGFVDAGLTRWQGHETNYAAPGLGLRLFLRSVALPAVGFDVAQATGMPSPTFTFAAGWRY